MLKAPNSTFSEDLYRFHWPDQGVELIVESFHDRGEDISTEIIVNSDDPLHGGRL